MDEGADIIMPVAGPVGLGAAAAIKERGNAYIIGVDSDWFLTSPDYADITLTSVMKTDGRHHPERHQAGSGWHLQGWRSPLVTSPMVVLHSPRSTISRHGLR